MLRAVDSDDDEVIRWGDAAAPTSKRPRVPDATGPSSGQPHPPLANFTYVVTGAGGGIGRACALLLVRRGAIVIAADIDLTAAEETQKLACEIRAEACKAIALDVSDAASVEKMVAQAIDFTGRLDGAVNAAGIEGARASVHESSFENWKGVMSVNLDGVYLCMRAEIRQILEQTSSSSVSWQPGTAPIDKYNYSIVNISSTAGQTAMPEFAAYSASKHAIIGLTKSAAKEYACRGIRVNAVCPSTTDTPMVARFAEQWPDWQAKQNASFPTGRIGSAEEVAAAVAFLLSAECRMMTGTCLTVDGALSS